MDKYLKTFEKAMKKWLAEHYSPAEAQKRWERTVALDEKWIREEGDLGGRKNPMASNMLEAAPKDFYYSRWLEFANGRGSTTC